MAAPALAQSASPVPARIGFIPVLGASPVFVADREGWLKDAGIAASFTTFESGPNMIQALASGTIDVYVARLSTSASSRRRLRKASRHALRWNGSSTAPP
ncbi:MAG: ABC transporter substrate-binding protein, partial [Rhodoplanes sp.]